LRLQKYNHHPRPAIWPITEEEAMIITKKKIDLIKRAAESTRRSADLFASNNNPSVQDIRGSVFLLLAKIAD
jgi:hypothetical protein